MWIFDWIFSKIRKLYIPVNWLYCRLHHVSTGRNFRVTGKLYIRNNGKIEIGDNVRINSAWWANPIGFGGRTLFQIFDGGELIIGDGCGISNSAFSSARRICLEENVMIGAGCKFYDTDFHPISPKKRIHGENQHAKTAPILIRRNAFIGAGVIILKGVTIGENAVIGAGSVVTKNVPANEIWAGNPAVKVSDVDTDT